MKSYQNTLAVVLAKALAKLDIAHSTKQMEHPKFVFRLLAASSSEEVHLPQSHWMDIAHLLKVSQTSNPSDLMLEFQAMGFQALQQVVGKKARLVTSNGLINESFGFNSHGAALLVLANSAEVRSALSEFVVRLEVNKST